MAGMPSMTPAFGLANGAGRRVRKTECPIASLPQNASTLRASLRPGSVKLPRRSDNRTDAGQRPQD
jgi:hypothetical protein